MVKLEINENSSFILITLTLIYCCFYFTDLQKDFKELKLYLLWSRNSE